MSEDTKELSVYVIKLKTGEELITALTGVAPMGEEGNPSDYLYQCLDPAFPAMDPQDPTQMALVPWMMFSENREFHILRSEMIIKPEKCVADITEQYKIYFAKTVEADVRQKKEAIDTGNKSVIITTPSASKGKKVVPIITE